VNSLSFGRPGEAGSKPSHRKPKLKPPIPFLLLLNLYAPFALLMLAYGTSHLILGEEDGAAERVHWIVATVAIFIAFYFGNKVSITTLAEDVADGDVPAMLTAFFWFTLSGVVLITLTFLGIAYPAVERIQYAQLGEQLRVVDQKVNRAQQRVGEAQPLFGGCAERLDTQASCERLTGCSSGVPSGKGLSPVGDMLASAAATCRQAEETFRLASTDHVSLARDIKRSIGAYEAARTAELDDGDDRRDRLYKAFGSVSGELERLDGIVPLAAGKATADRLKSFEAGVIGEKLKAGAEKARRLIADEGRRIDAFFADLDPHVIALPKWPESAPLTAVFTHIDRVWLHFLAACGSEAFPLLLFVFSVGRARRRIEQGLDDDRTTRLLFRVPDDRR
jgi:hypothetical protein